MAISVIRLFLLKLTSHEIQDILKDLQHKNPKIHRQCKQKLLLLK